MINVSKSDTSTVLNFKGLNVTECGNSDEYAVWIEPTTCNNTCDNCDPIERRKALSCGESLCCDSSSNQQAEWTLSYPVELVDGSPSVVWDEKFLDQDAGRYQAAIVKNGTACLSFVIDLRAGC